MARGQGGGRLSAGRILFFWESGITLTRRVHHLLVVTVLTAACVPGRPAPVSPVQSSAVAEARAALAVAAGDQDLNAFVAHLAPGATLIMGTDTLDLRTAVTRLHEQLSADAVAELWFADSRLRQCDRWVFESGGRLGVNIFRTGAAPLSQRYRYVIAWETDAAGHALVRSVAAISSGDAGQPRIPGCRPTARELHTQWRVGITLAPGSGYATVNALGDLESAVRMRAQIPRLFAAEAAYPAAGQSSLAGLASVWVRVAPRLSLEAVVPLGTHTTNTSSADTLGATVSSMRLEQRWTAIAASWRWGDVRIGAGPLLVRERWSVATDELSYDRVTAIATIGNRVGAATSSRTRTGLYSHAAFLVPVTGHMYAEIRGYLTALAPSASPGVPGAPPTRTSTSGGGIAVALGTAF